MEKLIKLEYEGKAISVRFKVPSLKLRKTIRDIENSTLRSQIKEKLQTALIEYSKIDPAHVHTVMDTAFASWALENGKVTWMELQYLGDGTPESIEEKELTTVELFRAVTELPKAVNDPTVQELLDSEATSDFWQSQNIVLLENELNSFRETIGVGRR